MANNKEIISLQKCLSELERKHHMPFFATITPGKESLTLYAFGAHPQSPTGQILRAY